MLEGSAQFSQFDIPRNRRFLRETKSIPLGPKPPNDAEKVRKKKSEIRSHQLMTTDILFLYDMIIYIYVNK
jgi:hypothetical protein